VVLAIFVSLQVVIEEALFFKILGAPEERVAVPALLYQKLLTSTSRSPEPRFTTIIQVDHDPRLPRLKAGVCAYRDYIASLIGQTAAYEPRAILVDMVFETKTECKADAALLAAVRKACGRMPVVLGFVTDREGKEILPHLHVEGEGLCGEGLLGLSQDGRKVSLAFQVPHQAGGNPFPTVAWKMAQLVDDNVKREIFPSEAQDDQELFTTLLDPDAYRRDGQLIPAARIALPGAKEPPMDPKLVPTLRGRIAVIGSVEEDQFDTNVGRVYGHLLQASYVEAILDGRVWRRISPWIQAVLGGLFWLAVDVPEVLWLSKTRWLRIVLPPALIIAGFFVLLAGNTLAVVFIGYYGDFPVISIASVVLWIMLQLYELRKHFVKMVPAILSATLLIIASHIVLAQAQPPSATETNPAKAAQKTQADKTPASRKTPDRPELKKGPGKTGDPIDRIGGLRASLMKDCKDQWREDRCEGRYGQLTGASLIRSFGQRLVADDGRFHAEWTCPEGEAESPVRLTVRTPYRLNAPSYRMVTVQPCGVGVKHYAWPAAEFQKLEGRPSDTVVTLELSPDRQEQQYLATRLYVPGLPTQDSETVVELFANRPFKSFQLAPDQPIVPADGRQFSRRVMALGGYPSGKKIRVCPVWDGLRRDNCLGTLIF
jgi:CHASE2 domain-containing sensor protein